MPTCLPFVKTRRWVQHHTDFSANICHGHHATDQPDCTGLGTLHSLPCHATAICSDEVARCMKWKPPHNPSHIPATAHRMLQGENWQCHCPQSQSTDSLSSRLCSRSGRTLRSSTPVSIGPAKNRSEGADQGGSRRGKG